MVKSGTKTFASYDQARAFQQKLYANGNRAVRVGTIGPDRLADGRYVISFSVEKLRGLHPRDPKKDRRLP